MSIIVNGGTDTISAGAGVKGINADWPAFSAWQSVSQNIANTSFAKLQLQTKEFDTTNAFDATTNFRFQPTIAGYYQISGGWGGASTAASLLVAYIYKNGTIFKNGTQSYVAVAGSLSSSVSAVVYLNGSTDFVELFGTQSGTVSMATANSVNGTYFQGHLLRAV